MTILKNAEQLLNSTRTIIAHQRTLERLRGENFNIFSILGLESAENRTHSAFLGELLNPKGSHLKGNIFLKLFLDLLKINSIDINSARLFLEHHIATRDDKNKTGGRIDIFIYDKDGNSLSIENKIYANEQYAQVERYYNYNTAKNKVLYLTLDGSEPSKGSKGELESGADFWLCSYRDDITKWLELCLKESADTPILRESIKQYLLLIKKLTGTMDKTHEDELVQLMFSHYEEATFIAENFIKLRQLIAEDVRIKVAKLLGEKLGDDFEIELGNTTKNVYSQIWVWSKSHPNANLFFGLESFSGSGWFEGNLFVGIFNEGVEKSKFAELDNNTNKSKWWVDQLEISECSQTKINLSNAETLKKLHSDKDFKDRFAEHIADESVAYIRMKNQALIQFLENEVKAQ